MWAKPGRFRRFLVASAVSSLGDGLLITGLPLLARRTTTDPLVLSGVYAAGRIPWALALVLGSFVDRRDARKAMVFSDLIRAVVLGLLGLYLVVASDPLPVWALLLLAVVLSVGSIVFFASTQRAVPALVDPADLEAANGALTATVSAGEQFIGPPMGALFITGGKIPVLGDAVSFALSAAVLAGLPPIPPAPTSSTLREDVRMGRSWFKSSPIIRRLTELNTWVAFLTSGVLATEVVLVRDTLGLSDIWFGVFTAVLAAGAIVGSSLASRVIRALGESAFAASLVVGAIAYLACAGSRSPVLVFVAMFFQQAATMVGVVSSVSIRQRVIPPALRGRVISLTRSYAYGSQIVGALAGGWMAKRYGTDSVFFAAAALILIGVMIGTRSLRRLIRANPAALGTQASTRS